MNVSQIIEQLKANFRNNLDRVRTLELTINPTSGDKPSSRKYVTYGTAGFRGRAHEIEHLFYKVGIIAGLRCLSGRRSHLGIMITASHNPVEDNGVKIIDSNGHMLAPEWESIMEKFCNISHHCLDQADTLFEHLANLMNNNLEANFLHSGIVMLGSDTRPSSEVLMALVKLGLDTWAPHITYKDYGQLTTPALHFLVGESTLKNNSILELDDYYRKLAEGLVNNFSITHGRSRKVYNPSQLVVDSANGVGSLTMNYLTRHEGFKSSLTVSLINNVDDAVDSIANDGILNFNCGADFVKTRKLAPQNADQLEKRYASLDGDADRVVYFYLTGDDEMKQLHLLDGDKILALFAYYLIDLIRKYKLNDQLSFGVVQTAYANGASTDFLTRMLGLQVDCVDTGVKHLHKTALGYDLSIYFEANGHGTIWVSEKAKAWIEDAQVVELKEMLSVLNNYTGDAVSDILIVESILNYYDWDVLEWDKLYEDRPNSLIKAEIEDRELVQTTNAGRTCTSPAGLQQKIDELVRQYGSQARAFVRASGTENVVRIYAECGSQDAANELAKVVGEVVVEMCNK